MVNGELGELLDAGTSQDELEQSLASISQPSNPVPITPAISPATATTPVPTSASGIFVTTSDGPTFISYEQLIASGKCFNHVEMNGVLCLDSTLVRLYFDGDNLGS